MIWLIEQARAENETIEEGMEGLDEDDLEAAWENLEMGRLEQLAYINVIHSQKPVWTGRWQEGSS